MKKTWLIPLAAISLVVMLWQGGEDSPAPETTAHQKAQPPHRGRLPAHPNSLPRGRAALSTSDPSPIKRPWPIASGP